LGTTAGWVDASQNPNAIVVNPATGLPYPDGEEPTGGISVNGAPLTPKFDLAMYIKGDQKPTVIYNAELYVEWDEAGVWVIEGVGDFNKDGNSSEILLRRGTNLSYMDANGQLTWVKALDTNQDVAGIGDFDSDGFSDDVLVRKVGDTQIQYLSVDNRTWNWVGKLSTLYDIEGIGDFDGDTFKDDVLIRKVNDVQTSYFSAGSGTGLTQWVKSIATSWKIEGVGNFDGDLASEFLIRDGDKLQYVDTNGTVGAVTWIKTVDPAWVIEGVGYFDNDAVSDVLLKNGTSLAYLKTTKEQVSLGELESASWSIEGVGDFNPPSTSDVLIRNGSVVEFMEVGGATTTITTSF
jgi:hypothetical protein